jgi:chlorophyll synthase
MGVSHSIQQHGVTARPDPKAVLTLLKPVTWFPPMWAFTCGVISTGVAVTERWWLLALGILITGPLVCASSQAVNDWFDREVDAINEPDRPIPSGRIPGRWGLAIAILWSVLPLLVAVPLGAIGIGAVTLALAFSWAYSAPPFRLKQNGWLGNAAVGFTYEGLAWVTGAALMLRAAGEAWFPWETVALAVAYSVGAHGIMTLNDFKAIEGDRRMGVDSLPVKLGPEAAAALSSAVMIVPQGIVVTLLAIWDRPWHALAIAGLMAVQIGLARWFTAKPVERALYMSAFGVPFSVAGMMVAAFALRGVLGA